MSLFVYSALIALAAVPWLYLCMRLYVASLLSLAALSAPARRTVGILAYLLTIPFLVAPLFAVLALPGEVEGARGSLALTAWQALCFALSAVPACIYLHRQRHALRRLEFFKERNS